MNTLHDRTTWLHGDSFHCLQPPVAVARVWRLVLLGPPGVGKGTQSQLLMEVTNACWLSTGDIFRAAHERSLAPGSPMGEAYERMKHGQLVPDDVVIALLRNRRTCLRCPGGFILDGFPRTVAQAAALDGLMAAEHVRLDAVIEYELPFNDLMARLADRRVCRDCGAPYHLISRPPKHADVCDHCGGALMQMPDDTAAAVRARLAAYAEATAQVAGYYERQNILLSVDASGSPDEVFARSINALKRHELHLQAQAAASAAT